MIINDFETALQLANEFLATKERENYYDFEAIDEEVSWYVHFANTLTDEEVTRLRTAKEKYGEEFLEHLDEVYDDLDVVDDYTGGCEIVDIDLDHVTHRYAFKIHELTPDGTVVTYDEDVELGDDEYAKLLAWHLLDEHLTINTLRHRDNDLYLAVMRGIDDHYYQKEGYYWVDNPYVATLDEAKADADAIVRQHDIIRDGGYLIY
jgi:hypothetical protein